MNSIPVTDLFFCICDHFEPYWHKADAVTARKRIDRWIDEYPKIAGNYKDSLGRSLKYGFFYPEEEYRKEDMTALAELCHAGHGEVEIHLHHDNDNPKNLRKILIEYKKRLHGEHGLLSTRRDTGEIVYGFIHGNWALDNSRPDGRLCGVNNEIDILEETGCYADFTMPSAPCATQTRKVNSIYYAVDDPKKPKSHDDGTDACVGKVPSGLLMVQGPLALDWNRRKWGIFPGIENGGLHGNYGPRKGRVDLWFDERIHVLGNPSCIFIKIYTHGCQERTMKLLFDEGGFDTLFTDIAEVSSQRNCRFHYVSPREYVGVIHSLQCGITQNK